jgi:ligand-binding sensor domain-containing protein/signal transduction histidine kinase
MRASKLFILLGIVFLNSCNNMQENKSTNTSEGAKQDTIAPLQVTVISTLPDSLQPKTIVLENMPKPLTVAVPRKAGGSYSITNSNGEVTKINLEPPVNKPLAVLKNEKGQTILNAQGKPFMMGDGGISNFTNFTTDNGLALDAIYCSVMDKSGNFWFGTNGGGVSRYDGKSFVSFTTAQGLANNNVNSILEDKSGNLWFGTLGGGVSRYDGKTFSSFTTAQGLTNNYVNSILEDKSGNLWFGTNGGGVSRYDGKTFRSFTTAQGLANNQVFSILEDKSGNLWFGTYGGGVSRFDGKSFVSFTTAQGLANNSVYNILEDKSGNLWFATDGGGVSRYDSKTFRSFTTAQGLASNQVYSILEDKNGNLWFGTNGSGVSRYDGKTFRSFTTAQGLANNSVYSILEDKSGNLWFGTDGGGMSRYDGKSVVSFTIAQGLANNNVRGILEDKSGNLWFGAIGGVVRYDGKSFVNFTTAQGLANNYLRSILEDRRGNLWFGTHNGVSRYDGKTFRSFTTAQGLANNYVYSILEDKSGNLWFGTNGGGVSRYDGKTFINFTTAQGLANNYVRSILEDKSGNLWFGTDGGGVSRYDGKTFRSFTTAQGLVNNYVKSILEDKSGNLWFGTDGGVSRYDPSAARRSYSLRTGSPTFSSFSTTQGLADDMVFSMVEDKQGNIIIGTNLGLTLIPVKARSLPFSEIKAELEYFNIPNGYPIKDVNTNAMLCDSKGIIWTGTGSDKTGLVRFDYAALHKNTAPPALVIQSVKVKDENICWYNLQSKGVRKNHEDSTTALLQEFVAYGKPLSASENEVILKRFGNIQFGSISKFYPLPQNLVLPYEHNQISFEFAAVETGRPFLVKYQYMLEGYDKEWSPVTNRSNASFGNINEGTYTFKLKAQGANGIWCKPIEYTFKVLPPFYRTWWAYLSYFIIGSISIIGFVRWRTMSLKKEKAVLELKVTERTIELKESLAHLKTTQDQLIQSEKLASLGELTAGIAHEIQNPLNFVNNFSELSGELIDEMNEEIANGNLEEVKVISVDLKQNLEKINHHGKRASSIVKGMLEHSRTSTGTKELTDINALTDEYLRLAYHGLRAKDSSFNADFKTDFDENLPKIEVIPQDIGRVLLNIINNAFYAVSVGRTSSSSAKVIISTKRLDNFIEIRITDNGIGMNEATKAKIFQPFFTTKPTGQGTGLGLSLAYDIITKGHGGTIEVESIEGEGTTFIVKLPI